MRRRYPSERFVVEERGFGTDYVLVEVASREAFMRRFDLHKKAKSGWSPFKPRLRVVFKA